MLISMIAAVAQNNVIGAANQLPWHIPEDLEYFKKITLGKPIIMGRKTFDSIAKPLPKRLNIVVTRQSDWAFDGVEVASTLEDALQIAEAYCQQNSCDEALVVGGEKIYTLAMAFAQRLYITKVLVDAQGDTFFPEIKGQDWRQISAIAGDSGQCVFEVFERENP